MRALIATLLASLCCTAAFAEGHVKPAKAASAVPRQASVPHSAKERIPFIGYTLQSLRVADTNPEQHVWAIEDKAGMIVSNGYGTVYQSLASPSLRQWVSHQPAGTTITYALGLPPSFVLVKPDAQPKDSGRELAKPQNEVSDFASFCKSKGIRFLMIYISA